MNVEEIVVGGEYEFPNGAVYVDGIVRAVGGGFLVHFHEYELGHSYKMARSLFARIATRRIDQPAPAPADQ